MFIDVDKYMNDLKNQHVQETTTYNNMIPSAKLT